MLEDYQILIMIMFVPYFIVTAVILLIDSKRRNEYNMREIEAKQKLYERLREDGINLEDV